MEFSTEAEDSGINGISGIDSLLLLRRCIEDWLFVLEDNLGRTEPSGRRPVTANPGARRKPKGRIALGDWNTDTLPEIREKKIIRKRKIHCNST